MKLIGFTGRAGSGKSEVAASVSSILGAERRSFAEPLKKMLAVIVPSGAQKTDELPELCGKTYRYALQTLGTEWGRHLIGEDFWAQAALRDLPQEGLVVFDDVRFDNEAQAIIALGGVIVRVERPCHLDACAGVAHASEAGVSDEFVHATVINDSTLGELSRLARRVIAEWLDSNDTERCSVSSLLQCVGWYKLTDGSLRQSSQEDPSEVHLSWLPSGGCILSVKAPLPDGGELAYQRTMKSASAVEIMAAALDLETVVRGFQNRTELKI